MNQNQLVDQITKRVVKSLRLGRGVKAARWTRKGADHYCTIGDLEIMIEKSPAAGMGPDSLVISFRRDGASYWESITGRGEFPLNQLSAAKRRAEQWAKQHVEGGFF